MGALATDLRKRLERAICDARVLAESGAKQALEALAVDRTKPHDAMDSEQRALRNALRAHGRQLGDNRDAERGTQEIRRLTREVAYQHWHRMLFARFLAENDLLIEPTHGVPVTLDECEELARERSEDPWALAASFAEGMLPQIFRSDDPALKVALPPETRQALERLLAALPPEVFAADDALGWTYQFWQAAEKEAVNKRVKSGEKITGETLPAVTQLFTEPYMVQFLLHNTIGAWHAGKVLAQRPDLAASAASEQDLRDAVALPGYAFDYLRFVREPREVDLDGAPSGPWRPAGGTYAGWPAHARDVKVLDPCCGSGHFLVAAFDLIVRLRMAEEGLALDEGIRAVLAENLFGLELDPRCTQIAAFHLALAAWKHVGRVIALPSLHIACSGLGPNATKEEWLALAEQAAAQGGMPVRRDLFRSEDSLLSAPLKDGLAALYETFTLAPELGSLIDPRGRTGDMYTAGFERIEPVLARMLDVESRDEETHERAVAARGMARAAQILTGTYTLVVTNVPYLGRGSQSDLLRDFAEAHHKEAKNDLATIFVSRMLRWVGTGEQAGTVAVVTPQNWLFLTSYKRLRKRLLEERSWNVVARLGPGAFETIGGHVVNVALLSISGDKPSPTQSLSGIDVSTASAPVAKAALLRGHGAEGASRGDAPAEAMADEASAEDTEAVGVADADAGPADGRVRLVSQAAQLNHPDARISMVALDVGDLLSSRCQSFTGLGTGDFPRYGRRFWELPRVLMGWDLYQGPVDRTIPWGGTEHLIAWDDAIQRVRGLTDSEREQIHNQDQSGQQAWGRRGVSISLMGELRASLYTGARYDKATAVLVPENEQLLPALWKFCSNPAFHAAVRMVDRNVMCSNGALVKVGFDAEHWVLSAEREFPDGLPEPRSDDPTQWIFHGHPAYAESHLVLQVAVARLLGYRWPAELAPEMRLASEARALVQRCKEFDALADADGIVCLPSVRGEPVAVDRLRALLARAFGDKWSAANEQDLLKAAGDRFDKGKVQPTLVAWLRDCFFVEHCALFHNRPFIWHIWDGRDDGFHALVNCHRLVGKDGEGRRTLETLAFTYLGEWIDRQRQHAAAGEEGADGRLAAALALQGELQRILEGEPRYDVFVRWKPLHEQPLGWDPDIDDGVRLNIRPFLMAKDVRVKGAGVLRARPDNTWSNAKKPGVSDRGKEPQKIRPRESFPWFWGCDPDAHSEHRIDFGAGTPGAAPAGREFTGVRWNGLHYSRAAKEAARAAAAERARTSGNREGARR